MTPSMAWAAQAGGGSMNAATTAAATLTTRSPGLSTARSFSPVPSLDPSK